MTSESVNCKVRVLFIGGARPLPADAARRQIPAFAGSTPAEYPQGAYPPGHPAMPRSFRAAQIKPFAVEPIARPSWSVLPLKAGPSAGEGFAFSGSRARRV